MRESLPMEPTANRLRCGPGSATGCRESMVSRSGVSWHTPIRFLNHACVEVAEPSGVHRNSRVRYDCEAIKRNAQRCASGAIARLAWRLGVAFLCEEDASRW